jgi:hypothetical protein
VRFDERLEKRHGIPLLRPEPVQHPQPQSIGRGVGHEQPVVVPEHQARPEVGRIPIADFLLEHFDLLHLLELFDLLELLLFLVRRGGSDGRVRVSLGLRSRRRGIHLRPGKRNGWSDPE